MKLLFLLAFLGGCVEPREADASLADAAPDGPPDMLPPQPCTDDRYGFGTPDLPAASLGFGRHVDLILCGAEGDAFALDAPVGLAVAALIEAERPVRLVAGDAESTGRNPMIRLRNPPGGLRVHITPLTPGPPLRYTLVLGLAPTTCDDAGEPDEAEPRVLDPRAEGVVCAGDVDRLRLTGPAGALVDLSIDLLGGQGVRLTVVRQVAGEQVLAETVEVVRPTPLPLLLPAEGLDLRIDPLGPGGGWAVSAAVTPGETEAGTIEGAMAAIDRIPGPAGLGPPEPRSAAGAWVEAAVDGRRAGLGIINDSGTFQVPWAAPAGAVEARLVARVGAVEVGRAGADPWSETLSIENDIAPASPTLAAVHIALTAAEGLERLRPFLGDRDTPLRIDWAPGLRTACGTCFRPESGHIELSGTEGDFDEWDDAIILHELGHHVAAAYGRDDSPGGRHDGDRTWPALAWSEGFATFHAAWQLNTPELGDLRPAGYQVINLETLEDPRAHGTHDGALSGDVSELLVAAILWDVFDEGDEDPVAVPAAVLWPALLAGLRMYTGDAGAPGLDLSDVLDVLAEVAPDADLAALAEARGYPWP